MTSMPCTAAVAPAPASFRAGLLAAAAILLAPAAAPAQLVLSDCVHRWAADGDAVDAIGVDDGTITGDVTYAPGHFNQAFNFNTGYLSFGTTAGNFGTSPFTVSFWFKTTQETGFALLTKRPVCMYSNMLDVRQVTSAGVLTELSQGTAPQTGLTYTDVPYSDGQWHHFAFRRDGTTLTSLIDGCVQDADTMSVVVNLQTSAPFRLGRSPCTGFDGTQPFTGQIDEVQLYSRALSIGEIKQLAGLAPLSADLNCDGIVNGVDLAILLGAWGPCPTPTAGGGGACPADLNSSGNVNGLDLAILLGQWT